LDVADGVLHAPFFVAPPDVTGHRFEAVVGRKIQVARVEAGRLPRRVLQHRRLEIVVHRAPGAGATVFERVAVSRQETFHALAQEKLDVEQPAVTEHGGEVMQLAQGLPDAQQAVGAPVNLEAIAGFKGQFEEGLLPYGPHGDDEVLQDGATPGVAVFGTQALKDLHAGERVFFQPADNQVLVGIELAGAPGPFAPRFIARLIQPFTHGFEVEAGLGGNLLGRQVQLPAQTAHLMVGIKVDHGEVFPVCWRSRSTAALSGRPRGLEVVGAGSSRGSRGAEDPAVGSSCRLKS
jgi:hypothetical protein